MNPELILIPGLNNHRISLLFQSHDFCYQQKFEIVQKRIKFMPEEINCIICNHPANIQLENLEGYQEGETFTIYHCSSCNTSFAWPHVINENIYDKIYSHADIIPGYSRYTLYANEITSQKNPLDYLANKEAVYFSIKEILEKDVGKEARILEVGAGLGYLTYAIRKEGFNIVGLDISSDAVEQAKIKFGDYFICGDIYEFRNDNEGRFDVIILTEVIEHISDPAGFCDALLKLIKNDGQLIITTPNKSSFSSEEIWETELPPVHLTWLSETSFKSIAKQKNLSLSFFNFSDFNKTHIDVTRFIFYNQFYKIKNRAPVLDRNGKVIIPAPLRKAKGTKGKLKIAFKKYFKPFFIQFLTHKKNINRNNVLCVILKKNR
jgi:2-polyprenyl-3-methyl-5-hydroxy-6-metoxy-1,4-benzoquinol methylase